MSGMRAFVDSHLDAIIEDLQTFVRHESPTTDKAACDSAGQFFAGRFRDLLGAQIAWHPQKQHGDHFVATVGSGPRRILVLGHFDTVWPLGTIDRLPCTIQDDRLTGPGSYDMKYGDMQALWGLKAMLEQHGSGDKTFVFLANSDEEVGSPTSRPLIEQLARESECVLVLEPSVGLEGAAKLWRKGVGMYRMEIDGLASHAGSDFEKGRSAVLELAHQIVRIHGLVDLAHGTTVNVGLAQGGTRSNVVAAHATANIDVRVRTASEAARIDAALKGLTAVTAGTTVRASGGMNRPPMEETAASRRMYELAKGLAAEEGFALAASGTGGGSDGNFTAALGIPTLDGLGSVGDGAHADHEYVQVSTIAPRVAWFARLLAAL